VLRWMTLSKPSPLHLFLFKAQLVAFLDLLAQQGELALHQKRRIVSEWIGRAR
jgi:hypothetical protein